jgi:hypothetical protein
LPEQSGKGFFVAESNSTSNFAQTILVDIEVVLKALTKGVEGEVFEGATARCVTLTKLVDITLPGRMQTSLSGVHEATVALSTSRYI